MSKSTISKYTWLLDLLTRRGRLTRKEINDYWIANTDLSDGRPMPRRSFHHYIDGIEQMFDLNINCDRSTNEYYIDDASESDTRLREWMLDALAISDTVTASRDISHRILLEKTPSARGKLPIVINALRSLTALKFSYRPYDRPAPQTVVLEPYCVRIFRQRWYVTGRNKGKAALRTYALDRISRLVELPDTFEMDPGFDAEEYFSNCVGIIRNNRDNPQTVVIRASAWRANYLRALPLHSSQSERTYDGFSLFEYHVFVTADLVNELLSMGRSVEVLKPLFLRRQIAEELQAALALYNAGTTASKSSKNTDTIG